MSPRISTLIFYAAIILSAVMVGRMIWISGFIAGYKTAMGLP